MICLCANSLHVYNGLKNATRSVKCVFFRRKVTILFNTMSESQSIHVTQHKSSATEKEDTNDFGDDSDVQLIMDQCGVSMETACQLLNKANGDLVDAIAYHLNPQLADVDNIKPKTATPFSNVSATTQDKLAQLREITAAKNAVLDENIRKAKQDKSR